MCCEGNSYLPEPVFETARCSRNIEHESAAVIRKDVQSRNDAIVGRYKQYFLRHTSKQTNISRSGPHAGREVKCRTSVAIPRAWVSHDVVNFLTGTYA